MTRDQIAEKRYVEIKSRNARMLTERLTRAKQEFDFWKKIKPDPDHRGAR